MLGNATIFGLHAGVACIVFPNYLAFVSTLIYLPTRGTTYKDTFQWTFDDQQAGIYLYMFRLNALTKKRVEDVLNDVSTI